MEGRKMPNGDNEIITFSAPREFAQALSRVAFDLDQGKSEVIRDCIKIALPILLKKSLLKDHVYLNAILSNGEK
jgi:hypothetical protein